MIERMSFFEKPSGVYHCMFAKDYRIEDSHINSKITIQDNVFLHEFLNDLNQMHYIQDGSYYAECYSDKYYSFYYCSLDNFLDNSVLNINLRKYFYLLLCCTYYYIPKYILTDSQRLKNLKCLFINYNY